MIDIIFMFALLVFIRRFFVFQNAVVSAMVFGAFALYFASETALCVFKLFKIFRKSKEQKK